MSGSLLSLGIQSSWEGQTPLCDVSRSAVQSVRKDTATAETWQYSCASGKAAAPKPLSSPVLMHQAFSGILQDLLIIQQLKS